MIIHREIITGTASSGSLSGNTNVTLKGILRTVIAKPATSSTTYDIKLTDNQSVDVYERLSETGTLSSEVALAITGIYTVTISNATVDEAFTIELMVQE